MKGMQRLTLGSLCLWDKLVTFGKPLAWVEAGRKGWLGESKSEGAAQAFMTLA